MRLVEGVDRISDPGAKSGAQARLGRFLHRRQPGHSQLERTGAQGRRRRPHDAGCGRRQCVERAGRRMLRRQQRHHPHAVRPHGHFWQSGGRRRQARSAQGHHAEGSEDLDHRRQAAEAARYSGQAHRQDDLRHRRSSPGNALCGDQRLPGVRRQGAELRGRQSGGHAGRQAGRESRRQCRRGRRRFMVAGAQGAGCHADQLGRGRQRQGVERHDRRFPQGRPRRRSGLRRQSGRRRQGRAGRRRQGRDGGLFLSVPKPRRHGADQRHGAVHGG